MNSDIIVGRWKQLKGQVWQVRQRLCLAGRQ